MPRLAHGLPLAWPETSENVMISLRLRSDLTLLFVAAVWGSGFVAQRLAAGSLSAFYFNGFRFFLAGLILLLLIRFRWEIKGKDLRWVGLAGVLLACGSYFQQAGLRTTNVSNAAFITGLYVIFIPIFLWVVWKEKTGKVTWAAALMAVAGIFLLSVKEHMTFASGDVLELLGAIFWAMHVILLSRLPRTINPFQLAAGQFLVGGLINLVVGFSLGPQGALALSSSWQLVLYSALIPVGLGFTLQVVGQKHSPPTDAAIILSMEAVFGALFGFLYLGEMMSLPQIMGCGLILASMILAQVKPPLPTPESALTAPASKME